MILLLLSEGELDERLQLYVDMEDPDIALDLRVHNFGHKSKYDAFWDEVEKVEHTLTLLT